MDIYLKCDEFLNNLILRGETIKLGEFDEHRAPNEYAWDDIVTSEKLNTYNLKRVSIGPFCLPLQLCALIPFQTASAWVIELMIYAFWDTSWNESLDWIDPIGRLQAVSQDMSFSWKVSTRMQLQDREVWCNPILFFLGPVSLHLNGKRLEECRRRFSTPGTLGFLALLPIFDIAIENRK